MNKTANANPVPHHHAHTHFYDYIEEFHGLPVGDTLQDQNKKIVDKLRHQYLKENDFEQKLCLRTCFKFTQKKYVDFCLEKKCGGVDFARAATILGLVKTHSAPKSHSTHDHHHHH